MFEIPSFKEEESLEIEHQFKLSNISFKKYAVQTSAYSWGGTHEYTFIVDDNDSEKAISLIKNYFEVPNSDEEKFTGICPGCNTSIEQVKECPNCELRLIFNPAEQLKNHPFFIFLKQKGL